MGTTITTLNSDSGIQHGYVLAIEGYEKLITDRNDTSAVVTAWSGTDWSTCISGLKADPEQESMIEPWSAKFHVPVRQFRIKAMAGDDTFGVAVFKEAAGNETTLEADLDANSTSMTVLDTSDFASSGTLYLGRETIAYTGKTATTFTGLTRGKYAPFAVSGGSNFGRDHSLPSSDFDTPYKPQVTDEPRQWVGRTVALYLHRIVGGVWDTVAQAECIFAGVITGIGDSGDFHTTLTCKLITQRLRECVLLRDQFRGRLLEGLTVLEDWTVKLRSYDAAGVIGTATLTFKDSPSGIYQAATGTYTADDMVSVISEFIADTTDAGDLDENWNIVINTDSSNSQEKRTFITHEGMTGTSTSFSSVFVNARIEILQLLGFSINSYDPDFNTGIGEIRQDDFGSSPTFEIVSDASPIKVWAFVNGYQTLTIGQTRGTWWNNRDWLPSSLKSKTQSGEDWGVLQIGDSLYLAKHDSDTSFSNITFNISENRNINLASENLPIIREGSGGGHIEVKQVAFIAGSLLDIVARIFASTGVSGYNESTYDDFPAQLGAAIPWDLLGTSFTQSLQNLAQSSNNDSINLLIHEPYQLEKLLGQELLLRGAWLLWKQGGLQFVQHPSPRAASVNHTLTENNKATVQGAQDAQRVEIQFTDRWIKNVLIFKYNRDMSGKYHDTITLKHHDSIQKYGQRVITIMAPNSFDDWYAIDSGGLDLFQHCFRVMAQWAYEVKIIERSVSPNFYYTIYPGDTCTVDDNYMRDPETGLRTVSGKPAVVLSASYDLAGGGSEREMYGKVKLAFSAIDRAGPYCPSATIDATTYSADTPTSGQSTITCDQHSYSESSEAVDASHFEAGDLVMVLERDNLSPTSWTGLVVISVSGDDVVLDQNLAGFDTSGTTKYVLTFEERTSDDDSYDSGQLSHVWLADDADRKIDDRRYPYRWADDFDNGSWTGANSTALPERVALTYEAAPVSTYAHYAAIRMANQLIDRKTNPMNTQLFATALSQSGDNWVLRCVHPIMVNPLDLGVETRKIYLSVCLKSSGGASVSARLTLTRNFVRLSSHTSIDWDSVAVIRSQASVSTTSTSYAWSGEGSGFDPVHLGPVGLMYLWVELKGNSAQTADLRGFSWRLGPLE